MKGSPRRIIKAVACTICAAMGDAPRLEKPKIKELYLSSNVVKQELSSIGGMIFMYPCLLDAGQQYRYTDDEGWKAVDDYIYKVFKWPKSISSFRDCDFYAFLYKSLVESYFGLNITAWAGGVIPEGGHAFNLRRSETGWWVKEPSPAFSYHKKPFRVRDERGYNPQYILL